MTTLIPDVALADQALSELEQALTHVADPQRPLWHALYVGAILRVRGDAALDHPEVQGLDARARARAFAYAASARRVPPPPAMSWRGAPPSEAMRAAVGALLAPLERPLPPLPELALALWAELPGIELPGIEQELASGARSPAQSALETAIAWGVPPPREAAALADRLFGPGDIVSDQIRVAIVKAHLDEVLLAAEIARGISLAALRLHALYELAIAADPAALDATAREAITFAAAEAYRETEHEALWPGAAHVQIAGIAARLGPRPEGVAGAPGVNELAEAALARMSPALETSTQPDVRARIYRLALYATPAFGVARWRDVVEALLIDRELLRDPKQRFHLLFEVAASSAWFRDEAARSEALTRVTELLQRITQPHVRALVCAELARRTAGLPGRNPAIRIGEAKKALAAPVTDHQYLPKTLRLLAETDARETLALARGLPRPEDRVLGAMMVAEAAAGIREA